MFPAGAGRQGAAALAQWPRRGRTLPRTRQPWLHALRGELIMSTSVCTT
jgi:hypothetical protein